ncbi:hypothetical protein M011DRAFT_480995 [Sporormia fimetaria CBS 119925]|uniref:Uncharacterized protein n=1 Tax=Sporormia fimetaria CBS 119925 TaxID=1340428 RepID=A0A6A6V1Y4_9PLEO|nr:hypothetical protein M011DRAFT_480995 [Sporormia fimetaria CBS 119925]
MPHLPFSATSSASSSASSSPSSSPSPPSIVLHPASGTSTTRLYKSSSEMASSYRTRYAQYLAATFNISLQAALAEADSQLQQAPRRCSDVAEAELHRDS